MNRDIISVDTTESPSRYCINVITTIKKNLNAIIRPSRHKHILKGEIISKAFER